MQPDSSISRTRCIPIHLPDGRIVFCSDRTGYLDEYHEERTETLFTMNGDGRGIEQITFLPGTYFEPSVLRDGRVLVSFWDPFHIDVPPFDKHETFLMTVNPDGTKERHLFGAGQYRFFNRERHSGIGLMGGDYVKFLSDDARDVGIDIATFLATWAAGGNLHED